jgi:hypothetical protein
MDLVTPDSVELWATARRLIEEYAASLDFDLTFQNFQHELQSLATEYGPPRGFLVIVLVAATSSMRSVAQAPAEAVFCSSTWCPCAFCSRDANVSPGTVAF